MPDINQRLVLYRRIASVLDDDDVRDIEEELLDRFGKLPQQVETLLEVARVKNLLREHFIVSVDFMDRQLVFTFHDDAEDSLDKILSIVSSNPKKFRFTPELKLFAKHSGDGSRDILQEIREILDAQTV